MVERERKEKIGAYTNSYEIQLVQAQFGKLSRCSVWKGRGIGTRSTQKSKDGLPSRQKILRLRHYVYHTEHPRNAQPEARMSRAENYQDGFTSGDKLARSSSLVSGALQLRRPKLSRYWPLWNRLRRQSHFTEIRRTMRNFTSFAFLALYTFMAPYHNYLGSFLESR